MVKKILFLTLGALIIAANASAYQSQNQGDSQHQSQSQSSSSYSSSKSSSYSNNSNNNSNNNYVHVSQDTSVKNKVSVDVSKNHERDRHHRKEIVVKKVVNVINRLPVTGSSTFALVGLFILSILAAFGITKLFLLRFAK